MLEIVMAIAAVTAMARIADLENRPQVMWGGITAAACAASLYTVPWPLLRILVAFIVVVIVYAATKFTPRWRGRQGVTLARAA